MKQVRMNTSLAGGGETFDHGQEYELSDAFAEALCADGRAELVEPDTRKKNGRAKAERTDAKPPESEER